MYLFRINSLSKKFVQENGEDKIVLDNISLMLPSSGLIAIIGKSGSGKSTLLNMLSLMDNPSSGTIYFNNENTNTWNKKRINKYHNEDIGIVFQHYHLLENETALFNVMSPSLIKGESHKIAKQKAIALLEEIGFKEKLYNQKCADLSGGEKERIAILRAIINNPKVVLADEPTGALDSKNSLLMMETLKAISEKRLVILVSHNLSLVEQFADKIISIKDGKVFGDETFYKESEEIENNKTVNKKTNKWAIHLTKNNFKRRFKRNLFSITGLIIGLVSSMLIIGFSYGSKDSVIERSYHQLDYGVATIYKETTNKIPGSKIALVQMSRMSDLELSSIKEIISPFHVEPNTDALLSPFPNISVGDWKLEELSYQPIYSFEDDSIDRNLLIKGNMPSIDSSYEVVINQTAYKYLKKKFKSEVIGVELKVHYEYENNYYTDDYIKPVIDDYFIYDKNVKIMGVVDDFNFLSTSKIFYSYKAFKRILESSPMGNLSTYLEQEVSWYDYLLSRGGEDQITSYSHRLFLIDQWNKDTISFLGKTFLNPIKFDSSPLTLSNTLLDLFKAATMGMELFLVIALAGTALIMGIISFSSYSEDKKTSAILTCLGASKGDIFSIYLYENLLIGGIALLVSLLLSPTLERIINKTVLSITGFSNIVDIPFTIFLNHSFLFPVLLIFGTALICVFATYIPLFFSKKISPRMELMEE